jgi:four helix bundle protein
LSSSFRDLIVWQKAIQVSVAIYQLTAAFPPQEMYGLTNQLRRASISVASNIAEGYGRASSGEYRHFLGVARGSSCEVETQLVLARELGFEDHTRIAEVASLNSEVSKMLNAIMKSLKP